jgi:hypothetical protein
MEGTGRASGHPWFSAPRGVGRRTKQGGLGLTFNATREQGGQAGFVWPSGRCYYGTKYMRSSNSTLLMAKHVKYTQLEGSASWSRRPLG